MSTTPDRASPSFDVVVVGAGPAGSCAAIAAARAGKRTLLIERGPFAGSKNMYGGVVYPRILDQLIPEWWNEMPVQRWITRRSTMVLHDDRALAVDFSDQAWGAAPYNGATALRPDFDHWLAGHAQRAGATLVCDTVVTGLLRADDGAVVGVTTDRPDGNISARVVIACDGVNSLLAKQADMYPHTDAKNFTLGVKEVITLPRETIEQRFNVRGNHGVDIEVIGCTSGVNGGGFVYTNMDSVAIGVVLKLPKLAAQKQRPEQIIADFKTHPAIAPLIEGGEVAEYSAHVIPEAGLDMMPQLAGNGLLIAGDAAAMCLAAGLWLEGVNFAMASGMYAGQAAALAIDEDSTDDIDTYREYLEDSFVLRDHRRFRRAPQLVLSDRVQHQYPQMITAIASRLFTVDNPRPKPGLRAIVRQERKRARVSKRNLTRDTWRGWRTFR